LLLVITVAGKVEAIICCVVGGSVVVEGILLVLVGVGETVDVKGFVVYS